MEKVIISQISEHDFIESCHNVLKPTIYITPPWISFLKSTVNGKFVAFEIIVDSEKIYTYGFISKILFFNLYCSPFERWNTPYIGFFSSNIIKDYGFIQYFYNYLKKNFHIHYFDISDSNFNSDNLKPLLKFKVDKTKNLFFDLNDGEETIFNRFGSHLRKRIRNYKNHGYSVAFCDPSSDFVDLYYKQLIEVFRRQKMKPFYSKEKIKILFRSFEGYERNILCAMSLDPNGEIIGTSIHLHYHNHGVCFGSASFDEKRKDNMNHVLRWECIKKLISEGCLFYDFGGYNPYKLTFVPNEKQLYRVIKSNVPCLLLLKKMAKTFISLKRKIFK